MKIPWGDELNFPNLLALTGVVATLVFGVLSIYLFARRRYPGRLVFMEEQCISLFEDLVKNLPQMQVLYEGSPVSDNLVLVKGLVVNVGAKDVSREMIEQPLQVKVSEGFKWLTAKEVSSSPDFRGQVKVVNEETLEFDLGLFRCEEYIRFEALAEAPRDEEPNRKEGADPAKELRKAMQFRHRIADTAKIEVSSMPAASSPWETISSFLFLLGFALATAWVLHTQSSERRLYYLAPNLTGIPAVVEASPLSKDLIKITGVKSNYEAVMPLNRFRQLSPVVGPRKREWLFRIYIVCILLILSGYVVSAVRNYLKTMKMRKILSR
jgi:hypothetical protein